MNRFLRGKTGGAKWERHRRSEPRRPTPRGVFTYSYDSYKRVVQIKVGSNVIRTFFYDSNPLDNTGFSRYTAGRLAAVQNASVGGVQFIEMYSYAAPGGVTAKLL